MGVMATRLENLSPQGMSPTCKHLSPYPSVASVPALRGCFGFFNGTKATFPDRQQTLLGAGVFEEVKAGVLILR